MAALYRIISTQPYTYLDQTGRVVNGFRVYVEFTDFGEVHQLDVPNLDPVQVKREVEALLKSRTDISKI